jgi:hypothetical protein
VQDLRKHKRYRLDIVDLKSKLSLVGDVEIRNISAGGAALRAERKMNIGKECLMSLSYGGNKANIKGIIIRSELSGIEERGGEHVTMYSAGVVFKEESAHTVKEFLASVEQARKTEVPEGTDWLFRNVRFSMTTPEEEVLRFPARFSIEEISRSGIIIETDYPLQEDYMVLLELWFDSRSPVEFMGKVVSSRTDMNSHERYHVGIEFSELTEQDQSLITELMEYVKEARNITDDRKAG